MDYNLWKLMVSYSMSLYPHMFWFCFFSWPYMLNAQIFSVGSVNTFSIVVHEFCNFFLKNMRSIWAPFNPVFEMFQGLFFAFLLKWNNALEMRLQSFSLWLRVDLGLEIPPILQWIFTCLQKMAIKTLKQNEKL